MNALKYTRRALVLLVASLTVFMSSCADTEAGIFSRVAAETPISNNMTEKIQGSTPSFVVRLGTTYYAGIGTLWSKNEGANTWKTTDVPETLSGTVFASSGTVIEVSGTETLFVAFSDSKGSSVWFKTAVSTWAQATGLPTDRYLRMLLSANDILFAVTANKRASVDTPEDFSIHSLTASTFVDTSVVADASIGFPNSVAHDGSSYWFTAGTKIIKGTSLSALSVSAGPTLPDTTTDTTSGVCAYGTGVVVSSRNGYLYQSTDGVTWNRSVQYGSSASDGYSFSVPAYLNDEDMLLVGTNAVPRSSSDTPTAAGYLQFDLADTFSELAITPAATAISSAINFAASLSSVSVNAMPYFPPDAGTSKVFALTVGDGLWSNTNNGTTWSGWVRE